MFHPQGRELGAPQTTGEADQQKRLVTHRGDRPLEHAQELDDPVARQRLLPDLSGPERPADAVQGVGHQAVPGIHEVVLLESAVGFVLRSLDGA